MDAEKVYKSFVEKAKYYLKDLDYYGRFQFSKHPLEGKWSIGQLYDHLIHGTSQFHLKEVRNCIEKKNGQAGGKKTWKGTIVFKLKSFPFKVKGLNSEGYKPTQPDSPEKVKDELYKFLKVMNRTAKELESAAPYEYKTKHPTLGMLNALEWFELIDIHYGYHKKLKKALDPYVRSHSKELASEEADTTEPGVV
jgi:hypothetical protein